MRSVNQEYSIFAQYFAPRGRERLLFLGERISQSHLKFDDRLIGIVGDAGSGKSSLIKGMFPGLELSNDDDTLNPHKIMQVRNMFVQDYETTTYHLDIRLQMAFTQMYEIVDFVKGALEKNRRLIIEHFDLLYPALGFNADLLIGIGEEIIVTRPNAFGPLPQSIYDIVYSSLIYRKMAHTAEDITILVLDHYFGISQDFFYSSDLMNGYVLAFHKEIDVSLDFVELEEIVRKILAKNLPVCYIDEDHIKIGENVIPCNGPRIHVRNTSEIKNFSFVKRFVKDRKTKTDCLVGLLTNEEVVGVENLNTLHFLKRD